MALDSRKRKPDGSADNSHSKRTARGLQENTIQGMTESSGAQPGGSVDNHENNAPSPIISSTSNNVEDNAGKDNNTDKDNIGRDDIARDSGGATINRHRIIVGVDYGTTYTGMAAEFRDSNTHLLEARVLIHFAGVSYVATDKSDIKDIAVITSWPGPTRDAETVSKVPSRIAYPFDNPGMQTIKCGFQVEARMKSYSWTKLLLVSGAPVTGYDDADLEATANMGILKLPDGKIATRVVTDFLESIYKHTMSTLAKQISQDNLDVTPIEFWFTVPAIWSDEAQHATRTAAQLAGFTFRPGDKMFMIPEPEAAVIVTLKKSTTDVLSVPIKVYYSLNRFLDLICTNSRVARRRNPNLRLWWWNCCMFHYPWAKEELFI